MKENGSGATLGMLLIATPRFRHLGEGLDEGSYEQRKEREALFCKNELENFCRVVYPGTVYTREDLSAAIRAFEQERVDGVFAMFLSWSEDYAWVRFLRDMPPVPVFFVCPTRDSISFSSTVKETDFVEFLSAGGLVGALEASGSVLRFNRPMLITAIGTLEEIVGQVKQFAAAAALRSALHTTSFGLLAGYNEVMWSTYVDPYNLFMRAGPELRFLSVASLVKEIQELDDFLVEQTRKELAEQYSVLEDVEDDKFSASVRASLALERLARKSGVSMVVLNDVDPVLLTEVGLRPGFLPCPGTKDIGTVPEGDIGAGLAVYILRKLSGKAVNLIEPFYIDRQLGCFAAGHAGPNDYAVAGGSVQISRDVRFAKTSYKYAGAPFAWLTIPQGLKTMLHVSECNGRFKLVCSLVEALPCQHFITSYSHGKFRPVSGSLQEFFDKLLHTGVTQHYGVVDGDYIAELTYLSKLLDFDFIVL